ncbi:MAG: hypothetical protein ACYTBS_22145 [Planctomycetota bacterium]|jgi:hypothetical protein
MKWQALITVRGSLRNVSVFAITDLITELPTFPWDITAHVLKVRKRVGGDYFVWDPTRLDSEDCLLDK